MHPPESLRAFPLKGDDGLCCGAALAGRLAPGPCLFQSLLPTLGKNMFERIIRFAIEQRWLVLLAVFGMAALGVFSYQKLQKKEE